MFQEINVQAYEAQAFWPFHLTQYEIDLVFFSIQSKYAETRVLTEGWFDAQPMP